MVAVIVQVPALTMETTFPATVATAVFELVYVKAPVLLEVGATNSNAASPNVFVGIEKLVIVGISLTVRVVVAVPDK
jgi:hypothetical protein